MSSAEETSQDAGSSSRDWEATGLQLPPLGQERVFCSAVLTKWVAHVYEEVAKNPTAPDFLRQYVEGVVDAVARDSKVWRLVGMDRWLWGWIYAASQAEEIKAVTGGGSKYLFDRAYFELEGEAFVFVNDLLRRNPSYDESFVSAECDALWTEIASGIETYEIGGPIQTLEMDSKVSSIPLGPGLELHNLADRAWVERHFDGDLDVPGARWAVVARLQRQRAAYETLLGLNTTSRDKLERTAVEQALLPLRIVRPAVHSTLASLPSLRFRVGTANYRQGDKKGHLAAELWTHFSGLAPYWSPFTEPEVDELHRLGAHFARSTTAEDYLAEHAASDARVVGLRAFNSAFTRETWQDRIVDCSVVLEALFSRDDRELSYKVAVRAAVLTGGDEPQAQRMYAAVRRLYDLRSQVVHAGSSTGKKAGELVRAWDGQEADGETESARVLRAGYIAWEVVGVALKAFLEIEMSGQHPFAKPFVESLDRALFDSGLRAGLHRRARLTPAT